MAVATERLAIAGGTPVRTAPYPAWPVFGEDEERLVLEVLRSGKWGCNLGDKVRTFEERYAAYQQARFGVCVPNGTLALELALRALEVGPGDEVITTPYTFIATASAALSVGAKPVFVDINPRDFTIDPTLIEAAITPRTKVILPVHIAGQPADMDAIVEIAERRRLRVLEDACQAWGAEWRGRRVGAIGDLGTFSFQAGKNITAGEGGIVVTNDPALHERCWSLHNVGRVPGGAWYQHEMIGWNLRMPEWEGAILLAQLERLPAATRVRKANAHYLIEALGEIDGIIPLTSDERTTQHARHLFVFRYDAGVFGGHKHGRDELVTALQAEGIPCSAGYVPLHQNPAIRQAVETMFGIPDADLPACPVAEHAADEAIWLPQHLLLGERRDMDDVVTAVRKIQGEWA